MSSPIDKTIKAIYNVNTIMCNKKTFETDSEHDVAVYSTHNQDVWPAGMAIWFALCGLMAPGLSKDIRCHV